MTRDQIISSLYTGKNFNECIGKMEPAHLREDLRQEIITIVCTWPDEKIIGLYNRRELDFYVVRVILNQVQSNSSPFYKQYRNQAMNINQEVIDDIWSGVTRGGHAVAKIAAQISELPNYDDDRVRREQIEDETLSAIDNENVVYWYYAKMLKLYIECGTYRAVEDLTGIPHESCYKTVKRTLDLLRQRALQPQKI